MEPEELKVGEMYNVRVRVNQIHTPSDTIYCCTLAPNGRKISIASFRIFEAAAFSPFNPYPPLNLPTTTKIPEPAPSAANHAEATAQAGKYDPCRLFKKGDKVRVTAWNGRDIARVGRIGYVVSDEYNSRVELSIDGWKDGVFYPACHLELISPEEEQDPYIIEHYTPSSHFDICWRKTGDNTATYWYNDPPRTYTQEEAKAAAEAECDRLNAEYRKEQSND